MLSSSYQSHNLSFSRNYYNKLLSLSLLLPPPTHSKFNIYIMENTQKSCNKIKMNFQYISKNKYQTLMLLLCYSFVWYFHSKIYTKSIDRIFHFSWHFSLSANKLYHHLQTNTQNASSSFCFFSMWHIERKQG